MTLSALLSGPEDVSEARSALLRSYHAMVSVTVDHATSALRSASHIRDVAVSGGPCAEVYTAYSDYQHSINQAIRCFNCIADLAEIICTLSESGDEDTDEAYAEHLESASKSDEIKAMLESANNKYALANHLMPKNPMPNARFDVRKLPQQES